MLENIYCWIAWKLPKSLVKWCYIRLAASSTYIYSDKTPDQINLIDALNVW